MVLPKKEKQVAFGSKLFLSIECKMLSMKILGCTKNNGTVRLRKMTCILKNKDSVYTMNSLIFTWL